MAAQANATHDGATRLRVSGMTCGNCARHVTEAIQSVPGVSSASVSLDSREANVHWAAGTSANPAALIQAIEKEGYGAKVMTTGETHADHAGFRGWQTTLWVGVAVTAALMVGEWALGLGELSWFRWLSFGLAGLVQFFSGAPFYRGAWRQLKNASSNMDTLVALGSSTAFGYSAWALLSGAGGHLYFMEAAAIITLISLGHWIEARVSRQAGSALKSLLQLAPSTARRIEIAGPGAPAVEKEVPVAELNIGDLVALRPGDRVPVDGAVSEGDSAVDESMLTGEPVPVDKKPGAELLAGTLNLNGRLQMRVTATGEQTALAHVIGAVRRAQTSRANIQRLGDRVSAVFVPAVVAVAVAAGLWWGLAPGSAGQVHQALSRVLWHAHTPAGAAAGFIIAAAVLIIACPCAMGLATPAAIMACANTAARRGILIRDGVALEKAGKVTAVIFDKTGTLTEGRPAVAQTWENPSSGIERPQRLAAALARHSTHPISQAVAKMATDEMAFEEWTEVPGAGLQARVSSPQPTAVRLGSPRWLRENGVDFTPGEPFASQWAAQGATVVGLAAGRELGALFALRDPLKAAAAPVIQQLRHQGLKIFLLTGDQLPTAASIARQAGIEPSNLFAEVRPEQKAGFVGELQSKGERVAFVGDGINDAPALSQADLGVAVSRASDVAREAADIILLKSEIEAVPEALGLAQAALRTIKQNLFWAFFYNALGVPLAALGFISPIFCAAAMGFSDVMVIGNALRLLRWRAPGPR